MTFIKSLSSYFAIACVILITSGCEEESAQPVKEIVVEKVVVETVDSAEIMAGDTSIAIMEGEIDNLNAENQKEKQTVSYLNKKVNRLQVENDSLMTDVHHKNDVIKKLAISKQENISNIELHARAFIQDVNNAWKNLPGAKNNEEMLQYFLPSYAVSMVSVGLTEKAEVGMLYPEEFENKLDGIRKKEGLTLQIGNVNYLYFEGTDNVYTIVYKAIFRVYEDNVPVSDRAIVATVTVKRIDGQFKIGKYSWVSTGHRIN